MAGGSCSSSCSLTCCPDNAADLQGQAGSKNGHSSWVSWGDAQAAPGAASVGADREVAFAAPKLLSPWHCCFMKRSFAVKIFVNLYRGA